MSSQSGMAEREAKEENTKSAWCETELASNKQLLGLPSHAINQTSKHLRCGVHMFSGHHTYKPHT